MLIDITELKRKSSAIYRKEKKWRSRTETACRRKTDGWLKRRCWKPPPKAAMRFTKSRRVWKTALNYLESSPIKYSLSVFDSDSSGFWWSVRMNTANSPACPLAVLPLKRIEPLRISSLVSMKDKSDGIFLLRRPLCGNPVVTGWRQIGKTADRPDRRAADKEKPARGG